MISQPPPPPNNHQQQQKLIPTVSLPTHANNNSIHTTMTTHNLLQQQQQQSLGVTTNNNNNSNNSNNNNNNVTTTMVDSPMVDLESIVSSMLQTTVTTSTTTTQQESPSTVASTSAQAMEAIHFLRSLLGDNKKLMKRENLKKVLYVIDSLKRKGCTVQNNPNFKFLQEFFKAQMTTLQSLRAKQEQQQQQQRSREQQQQQQQFSQQPQQQQQRTQGTPQQQNFSSYQPQDVNNNSNNSNTSSNNSNNNNNNNNTNSGGSSSNRSVVMPSPSSLQGSGSSGAAVDGNRVPSSSTPQPTHFMPSPSGYQSQQHHAQQQQQHPHSYGSNVIQGSSSNTTHPSSTAMHHQPIMSYQQRQSPSSSSLQQQQQPVSYHQMMMMNSAAPSSSQQHSGATAVTHVSMPSNATAVVATNATQQSMVPSSNNASGVSVVTPSPSSLFVHSGHPQPQHAQQLTSKPPVMPNTGLTPQQQAIFFSQQQQIQFQQQQQQQQQQQFNQLMYHGNVMNNSNTATTAHTNTNPSSGGVANSFVPAMSYSTAALMNAHPQSHQQQQQQQTSSHLNMSSMGPMMNQTSGYAPTSFNLFSPEQQDMLQCQIFAFKNHLIKGESLPYELLAAVNGYQVNQNRKVYEAMMNQSASVNYRHSQSQIVNVIQPVPQPLPQAIPVQLLNRSVQQPSVAPQASTTGPSNITEVPIQKETNCLDTSHMESQNKSSQRTTKSDTPVGSPSQDDGTKGLPDCTPINSSTTVTIVDMIDSMSDEQCRALLLELANKSTEVVQQIQLILDQPIRIPQHLDSVSQLLSWFSKSQKPALSSKNKVNILMTILKNLAENYTDYELQEDESEATQWSGCDAPCSNQEFPIFVLKTLFNTLGSCDPGPTFDRKTKLVSDTMDQLRSYQIVLTRLGFNVQDIVGKICQRLEEMKLSCLKRPRPKEDEQGTRMKEEPPARKTKVEQPPPVEDDFDFISLFN